MNLIFTLLAVLAPLSHAQIPTGDDQIFSASASTVAVTTNAVVAIPANPKATKTIVINEGPSDMRLGISTVTTSVGLFLKANGLPVMLDDGKAYFTAPILAISTGGPAASKLSIFQGTAP